MAKAKKKKTSLWKKFLIAFGIVVLLFAAIVAFSFYQRVYGPNVTVNKNDPYIYIPTGTNYNNLLSILQQNHLVHSIESFDWVARQMNLQNNVHAGKYRIESHMSNYALASLLRSGKQEPVKLVINKFRLKEEFVGFVSHKIEADSLVLITALNDSIYLRQLDMNPDNAIALFIPNTYEFYWNTSAEAFLQRMKKEYDRFWNEERTSLAAQIHLSTEQVITLASIVEEETNYAADKPLIASVYLNRLKAGMPLQADPTVKFAQKNFALKRILDADLDYDSDYNTYERKGLPPGPICIPSIASIDSVLHAARTDYFYFCADPDKPGASVFAKTLQQHQLNAKRYQHWLDQNGR